MVFQVVKLIKEEVPIRLVWISDIVHFIHKQEAFT